MMPRSIRSAIRVFVIFGEVAGLYGNASDDPNADDNWQREHSGGFERHSCRIEPVLA